MTTSNESTSILIVVGEVTEQNCELSAKLNRSPWLIGVAFAHVFISICGLIAMYSYFKTPPIRKAVGLIDTNLKIISAVGFFYCFWGFTSAMFVYLYRLYIYVRNPLACDYIWSARFCYIVYSQHNSACSIGYTSFHIALLGERLYATFYESNRERWPVFGVLLGLLILVFPQYRAFVVNYPYYNENKYLYDRVYCSSLVYSSAASNRLILSSFINLLALDFTITVADFCLLLYNKKQIAKYYRKITVTYTLAKSFSLRGAQISIGLIYPFSVTHSCSYSTVTLFYIVYLLQDLTLNPETDQLWRESVNLMRTLNNVLLFSVLCFVHRRQRTSPSDYTRNDNEANHYFQQFNQMIS